MNPVVRTLTLGFLLTTGLGSGLAACADGGDVLPSEHPDGGMHDAAGDATSDGSTSLPLAGFGAISGTCDQLGDANLTSASPGFYRLALDFGTDRYDDPAERPLLAAGGQEMLADGNAGGSSVFSEVFAYEVLHRCELAEFLKSETKIVYDTESKKTDLLVKVDGHQTGVSVTRAVAFPFGNPYTEAAAKTLLDKKLGDIPLATASVSEADQWGKQILAYLAWDDQHADMVEQVWNASDAGLKGDTLVIVITTDGDDEFIYTDM